MNEIVLLANFLPLLLFEVLRQAPGPQGWMVIFFPPQADHCKCGLHESQQDLSISMLVFLIFPSIVVL